MGAWARVILVAGGVAAAAFLPGTAFAAKCGNNASGFETWKKEFAAEAKARGIKNRGLQALAGTRYATKTISADRNQKSFKLSLSQFMQKRGATAIMSKGKSYVRAKKLESVIHAIIYPDRRGDGFGIGRYEDHPGLDFSRVEGEPDVHFAHKSGFMCKTSATEPARLQALIRGAWLDA